MCVCGQEGGSVESREKKSAISFHYKLPSAVPNRTLSAGSTTPSQAVQVGAL